MAILKKIASTKKPYFDAILISRVMLGICFIKHGWGFFDAKEMAEFTSYLDKDLGFPIPGIMAYLRTGSYLFGGIMLVLGFFTRIGAFFIAFTMLVATFTAGKGDVLGDGEMTFMYAMFCIVFVIIGSGKFSVDNYLYQSE